MEKGTPTGEKEQQGRGGGDRGSTAARPTLTRDWGGPQVRDPVPIVSVKPEAHPPQPRAPVRPNRAELLQGARQKEEEKAKKRERRRRGRGIGRRRKIPGQLKRQERGEKVRRGESGGGEQKTAEEEEGERRAPEEPEGVGRLGGTSGQRPSADSQW